MLFIRWKFRKNKKALSLIEMIVAIAVTAILAVCLSMVMSPVMNTFTVNKARAALANYADSALEHVAADFRSARNIMLVAKSSSSPYPCYSMPSDQMGGKPAVVDIRYGYCLHDLYLDADGKSIKGNPIFTKVNHALESGKNKRTIYPAHLYYSNLWSMPDLKEFDSQKVADNMWHYTLKDPLSATGNIVVDGGEGFYMFVRKNPNDSNRGNIIEIHLKLKKGKITYHAVKSVVCENLVINKMWVQKATVGYNSGGIVGKDDAVASTSDKIGSSGCNPYYAAWFGIGVRS